MLKSKLVQAFGAMHIASELATVITLTESLWQKCSEFCITTGVQRLRAGAGATAGTLTNILTLFFLSNIIYENRDMAIAMSSSGADPVLGAWIKYSILLPRLGVFKYINLCHTALAGGI